MYSKGSQPAFSELAKSLGQLDRKMVRGETYRLALVFGLFALTTGYMTWLFLTIGEVKPEVITAYAGQLVEEKLPDLQDELRKQALREAPNLVDAGAKKVLQLPVLLREKLEHNLTNRTQATINEMEQELNTFLSETLTEELEKYEKLSGDGTGEEKFLTLLDAVRRNFRDQTKQLIDNHYHEYAGEINRINDWLRKLKQKENLTEKEEIQKELIEVLLVLVFRKKQLLTAHEGGVGN